MRIDFDPEKSRQAKRKRDVSQEEAQETFDQVYLTNGMLRELDARAARLNISRHSVIKTLIARALNEERPKPKRKAS